MTRRMTAAGTAALCAILLVTVQINTSAQSKTPAKAPAKAAPAKAAAPKVVAAPAESGKSVTLTGCLEADGRKYMLTDLEGAQAPKGRSWKTGYVTQKSKDMEVVATSGVKLGDHIGHKVSVVGVRNDTHLQARSIKQLAASCS